MSRIRVAIAVPGIALGLFGVFRLLTEIPNDDLVVLAFWLVAAVVIHDGILSPVLVAIGWLLAKLVPPRARAFVTPALVVAGIFTVIAAPMIYREGTQPASKGVLEQDYTTNLLIAFAGIAVVTVLLYVLRVLRDGRPAGAGPARPRPNRPRPTPGQPTSETNVRPPDVQDSSTA